VPGTGITDAKQVFRRRVQRLDEQVVVDDDDCRTEAVEYRIAPWWLIATLRRLLAGILFA